MKAVFVELPPFEHYRADYRVIYYWWDVGLQFWLFTIYDKNEMSDLTKTQREMLRQMIKNELEARRKQ